MFIIFIHAGLKFFLTCYSYMYFVSLGLHLSSLIKIVILHYEPDIFIHLKAYLKKTGGTKCFSPKHEKKLGTFLFVPFYLLDI